MAVPFDTHVVVQQLEHLGFPPAQAEGLMTVLAGVVTSIETSAATKADLGVMRAEIQADIAGVRGDIRALDHRFSVLNWSLGVGASVMTGLLLLGLNWLWQLMQRVH